MGSLLALQTGLTGLSANARKLEVIGNNIANANTTAFKTSRLMFENQVSLTPREGAAPSETDGGENPYQIGLGVQVSGTQRNFGNGALAATGDPRDLAIDGRGLFIVQRDNQQLYTRSGAFRQDSNGDLVTINGERLQGYGVDSDFQIQAGPLQNLNVPIGPLTIRQATQNARSAGNLNASGTVATTGDRKSTRLNSSH